MQFQPKTEQDIRNAMCLPPGEYDFEVADATDTVSKKGNDMIAIELRVFAPDGSPRLVRDWLVAAMELKLNHFTRATGLEECYQSGELNAYTVKGVSGRCTLTVTASEQYGDQNSVKDYIPVESVQTPYSEPEIVGVSKQQADRAKKRDNGLDDSGIPF